MMGVLAPHSRDRILGVRWRSDIAQRGITMVELLLVLAIVAALSVIAIPAYRGYSQRAQRTEATAALLRLATNQERFYFQNNIYSNNPANLGFATGETENGLYRITIGPATAQTYTATATPVSGRGQAADADCQSFTIDSAGVRGASPGSVADCWGGR